MWAYYNNGLDVYESITNTAFEGEVLFDHVPTDEEIVLAFPDYLIKKEEIRIANNTSLRSEAYKSESDPIFFQWQRGEKTQQEWLDKVAEIKQRYS
jgi:hypothetical protein